MSLFSIDTITARDVDVNKKFRSATTLHESSVLDSFVDRPDYNISYSDLRRESELSIAEATAEYTKFWCKAIIETETIEDYIVNEAGFVDKIKEVVNKIVEALKNALRTAKAKITDFFSKFNDKVKSLKNKAELGIMGRPEYNMLKTYQTHFVEFAAKHKAKMTNIKIYPYIDICNYSINSTPNTGTNPSEIITALTAEFAKGQENSAFVLAYDYKRAEAFKKNLASADPDTKAKMMSELRSKIAMDDDDAAVAKAMLMPKNPSSLGELATGDKLMYGKEIADKLPAFDDYFRGGDQISLAELDNERFKNFVVNVAVTCFDEKVKAPSYLKYLDQCLSDCDNIKKLIKGTDPNTLAKHETDENMAAVQLTLDKTRASVMAKLVELLISYYSSHSKCMQDAYSMGLRKIELMRTTIAKIEGSTF